MAIDELRAEAHRKERFIQLEKELKEFCKVNCIILYADQANSSLTIRMCVGEIDKDIGNLWND